MFSFSNTFLNQYILLVSMSHTILDCYTDEASGLGVPPYLGTHPRYIAGYLKSKKEDFDYITIDDLRFFINYNSNVKKTKKSQKTNIKVYNLTKNFNKIKEILQKTQTLIVVLGIHVPGKYLSAMPATLKEVIPLIENLDCKKILTGPAVFGTQLFGGKLYEKTDVKVFDEIKNYNFKFDRLGNYPVLGSEIIKQIPDIRVIEIETGRGCNIGKCSFCTEPIKSRFINRNFEDIINEIEAFYKLGSRYFRLGKQADFYAYDKPIELLKTISGKFPKIKVLHIDNVNPNSVVVDKDELITKAVVKYCSEGNVAAFGVESFDPVVVKENLLNTAPSVAFKAIKIINKHGQKRGKNGMPAYLPGINIIFGLMGETKNTHKENIGALKKIMDENLMLRRINIRQVAVLPETLLFKKAGNKFIKKNKKHYWSWRKEIRTKIDFEMLKRIVPNNQLLKDIRMEIYDGNTTFGRQIGTYPLIVGIKGRHEIGKFYDIKVKGHMLRSVTGDIVKEADYEDKLKPIIAQY